MARQSAGARAARGFTLIELLVVILIIGLVSVLALPAVIPALSHRQVSEAGRILQGVLVGARDKAIHDGQPSGIRLLPDPAFWQGSVTVTLRDGSTTTVPAPLRLADGTIDPAQPIAWSRIVPIGPAPEYAEGAVTVRIGAKYGTPTHFNQIHNPAGLDVAVPSLVLEEAPLDRQGLPNPPTSWSWNVRVGDKIQLNNAGPWYTVVGPQWTANPEGFVNYGAAGVASPLNPTGNHPIEWLILVDGHDDDDNGWADEGFDGIDNDGVLPGQTTVPPGLGIIDDAGEWEVEQWGGSVGSGVTSVPYAIRRRPMPTPGAREIALPTHIVIDSARSRLPVDPRTGTVDLLIQPDGTAAPSLPYGVPSSLGMGTAFDHFALLDRTDIVAAADPMPAPKGDWSILTLLRRTGQIVVSDNPDPADPYSSARQGAR